MRAPDRSLVSVALLGLLVGCGSSGESVESAGAEARADNVLELADGEVSATVRTDGFLPLATMPLGCRGDGPDSGARPLEPGHASYQRYAWIEMHNPREAAVSVALTADTSAMPWWVFAYDADRAPMSVEEADRCLLRSTAGDSAYGIAFGDSRGIVVPGHGRVGVLVTNPFAASTFVLHAQIQGQGPADVGRITLPRVGTAGATLLVSGRQRTRFSADRCSSEIDAGIYEVPFGYLEVTNPSDETATVDVAVAGAGNISELRSYRSSTPPTSAQEYASSDACFSGGRLHDMSLSGPRALVVPAHESRYVQIKTSYETGVYTVTATRR